MIILEGANGGGKTSYAGVLAGMFSAPMYRPFRAPGDWHHGEEREKLEALGVPVNTWMDDMYLADMSRIVDNQVIVDRSMPSAIVYDIVEKQGTLRADWVKYMLEWETLLVRSKWPALIVRLIAPYRVARERMTGHIPDEEEYHQLNGWFERVLAILDHIPVITIDTSMHTVPEGTRLVKERYRELCPQASNNSAVG